MFEISKVIQSLEDATLPPVPADVAERIKLARYSTFKDVGQKALAVNQLSGLFGKFRCDITFVVNAGCLAEEFEPEGNWVEFWNALHSRFPLEPHPISRLMTELQSMRSYVYGVSTLKRIYPDIVTDHVQRAAFAAGFLALGYHDRDGILSARLEHALLDDVIFEFASQLLEQRRPKVAVAMLLQLSDEKRAHPLVEEVRKSALSAVIAKQKSKPKPKLIVRRSEVVPKLVQASAGLARPMDPTGGLGPIVFFTGQLGAGGAERQMSRLSCELFTRQKNQETVGGVSLNGGIHVCLRNVDSARRGDFFLPVLQNVGLEPTLIDPMPVPALADIEGLSEDVKALLPMLRKGIRETTLKLIPYFQRIKPDVAYLWQDGGAMAAGLAALLTGTPRVVISFRGLSPDRRPDRLREEMPILFREMIKLPQVIFSANSRAIARDYERWLELPSGTIKVISNAVQDLQLTGDEADQEFWDDIVQKSPDATKTVMGLFRFDPNKRPQTWIKAAAKYLSTNTDTRFMIVGAGAEAAICESLIHEMGMSNRIFLAGNRKNVGFYLHKADLVLHLAETEGLPNALIEAQMCGVPVLATPAGGTGEVVLDGQTGKLFASAETISEEEIVEGLEHLLADPVSLAEMGREAHRQAQPRFNLENVLSSTLGLFVGSVAERSVSDDAEAAPLVAAG